MKKKTVSFHSSRGGTGKTIISVNLAALLANKGLNVALIDLDFRAPNLFYIFEEAIEQSPAHWVNDYLNSKCKPEDFLVKVHKNSVNGTLSVGFADPSVAAIEDMLMKSRAWEANAIKRLFGLRDFLFDNTGVDFCIYDTSPGIQYSSLNAIICSDLIVFVSSSDPTELKGIENILKEFNDVFRNKTFILLNKVFPETDLQLNDREKDFASQVSRDFRYPVIGIIPCYCDVLRANKTQLLSLINPNHPFSKKLEEIGQRILLEQ
jgi:MinD-like ATPase involved in chromosome partitioning or flagellar assembly